LHRRYGEAVAFFVVYIQEAHTTDGWQMPINEQEGVVFEQPRTEGERESLAEACVLHLNLSIPTLVDGMTNEVDRAYAALPDRMYLIDAEGRVAYRSEPGPWGFKPEELEALLNGVAEEGWALDHLAGLHNSNRLLVVLRRGVAEDARSRERTRRKGATEVERLALHAALLYGITEDVNIALALPLVQRRSVQGLAPGVGQVDRDATGVGDAIVRAKWRFFHTFSGTTQYHAAVIGGVKVPLGNQSSDPPLGSGSIDFLAGATISRDALRSYLWTSALLRVNGEAFGIKRGKEYRYDAAVGLRPWIPTYTGLDLLLLVELNGVTADRLVLGGVEQAQTGGTILALSPGFWLTRRNWALKGGLKLPVLQDLRGDQPELDYTVVLAIETHM
jgi:hypothetical protein